MKVPLFDLVGDKKIPNIQMFSSLGTESSSVVLEENSRLIVLVHDNSSNRDEVSDHQLQGVQSLLRFWYSVSA